MMCVSKGAPKHPKEQTEQQKGIQELWNFMHSYNAVFVGDPTLKDELDRFLRRNKIRRGKFTRDQRKYTKLVGKVIEKALP